MTGGAAFRSDVHTISSDATLEPFPVAEAEALADAFVLIDPWRRLGFKAERLAQFFARQDGGSGRFAIRCGGTTAGFVCIDAKWLCGPYLHFLGVLPAFQGRGLGSAVVDWFVAQARLANDRNAWVCVSHFNAGARALYAKHGFAEATTLHDLMQDGEAEVLMRKLLFVAGNVSSRSKM